MVWNENFCQVLLSHMKFARAKKIGPFMEFHFTNLPKKKCHCWNFLYDVTEELFHAVMPLIIISCRSNISLHKLKPCDKYHMTKNFYHDQILSNITIKTLYSAWMHFIIMENPVNISLTINYDDNTYYLMRMIRWKVI